MRNIKLIALLLGVGFFASSVSARQLNVNSLRFWTAPDHTRLVFDTSGLPKHEVFLLDNPKRLVIDISNARLAKNLLQPPVKHPLFAQIRYAKRNQNDLRIVVDLKKTVNPKSFSLQPNKEYGYRLVVDLFNKSTQVIAKRKSKPKYKKTKAKKYVAQIQKHRNIIVAIDAGHGGDDPGALGPRGTKEKKIVLAIAKKLARYIDNHPYMQSVLVRKGDYYVGLRKRMQIARAANANLFISIHADAFKNPKVKGASVFTLSKRGASSEAGRWLARHENSSDLVGGVSLDDKDNDVALVLLDMAQTGSQEVSQKIASKILRNFGKIGKLHNRKVQKARFMVLKSPDIPSILVETAYISNPGEERKLRSSRHQSKMAKAIYDGVVDYFQLKKLPATRMASTKHKITRGETLSGLAVRYGVSMRKIKVANSLASNKIRIGQVLQIPKS